MKTTWQISKNRRFRLENDEIFKGGLSSEKKIKFRTYSGCIVSCNKKNICKFRYVCKSTRKRFFKNKKTTVTSYAINALGDIPYDELEELLNRDRSQLHRWNKASEMREHRPKRLDHCKIPHDELGTYMAAHQGLFDSSLPIFAAASSIIEREFSVMLIVQRKYVVDYE